MSRLTPNKPLAAPLVLGASENLKIVLTTKDGSTAKRPHQTFLNLRDHSSGLETSFPFQVKENGKGKLELVESHFPAGCMIGWTDSITVSEGRPTAITIVLQTLGGVFTHSILWFH